ncbi:MAG: protein-export chaperone SecB [Porphyromonas pasteri]
MTSPTSNSNRASFRLKDYRVVRSEINLDIASKSLLLQEPESLIIDIDPKGSLLDTERHLLSLRMNVGVYSEKKEVDIKVSLVAHFEYKSTQEDELDAYIVYNAPAIIFPYVRAYISSLTGLSGISPIILPTLKMEKFGKKLLELLNEEK